MTLGLHRCGLPTFQAQAEQMFLVSRSIFSLLFRSWVSIVATVVVSILNQVPCLPISGCFWGVVYKWHKTSLVFLRSFSTELGRVSLGLGSKLRFLQVLAQPVMFVPKVSSVWLVFVNAFSMDSSAVCYLGWILIFLCIFSERCPHSVANCWHNYSILGIAISCFCCNMEIACNMNSNQYHRSGVLELVMGTKNVLFVS